MDVLVNDFALENHPRVEHPQKETSKPNSIKPPETYNDSFRSQSPYSRMRIGIVYGDTFCPASSRILHEANLKALEYYRIRGLKQVL